MKKSILLIFILSSFFSFSQNIGGYDTCLNNYDTCLYRIYKSISFKDLCKIDEENDSIFISEFKELLNEKDLANINRFNISLLLTELQKDDAVIEYKIFVASVFKYIILTRYWIKYYYKKLVVITTSFLL